MDEFPAAVITGSPTLHESRLYVPVSSWEEVTGGSPDYECCKFRGSLTALDAATGTRIWKSYTIPETPRPVRRNNAFVFMIDILILQISGQLHLKEQIPSGRRRRGEYEFLCLN